MRQNMKSYLKQDFDAFDFLRTVRTCSGDVIFRTREGDVLNLKSQLCMYLFAAASTHSEIMERGVITCADGADYEALARFLQTEPETREGDEDVSV